MRHRWTRAPALWAGLLATTSASACPDCPSARAVRVAVFEGGFWGPLVMVAVPFLCLGFLSALLYRVGLPTRKGEE
ncbi:hypothetical protein [Melittangium boletus]|uniref:Uncharacterized protein n=1 Tax=Melittangium boletus DSM 14713 TaxID=1294270 RepID=A0A250IJ08_9BACT|nr:hypothetical protein [Melittangium boletus]ATB31804.1 hypothetical protein MEBOL_005273 [Melittangium boletus DSM 14713]